MAIPKKGSRKICVDGVRYLWVARNPEPAGVRITVQKASPAGSVLTLRSDQDRAVAHIPPAQVAHLIQLAVAAGWDPHRSGPSFEQSVAL